MVVLVLVLPTKFGKVPRTTKFSTAEYTYNTRSASLLSACSSHPGEVSLRPARASMGKGSMMDLDDFRDAEAPVRGRACQRAF